MKLPYRSQCGCACHDDGVAMLHMLPCCQPDPRIFVIGDSRGELRTGKIQHSHGVHMQNDRSWLKGKCPTCGYEYDESEYGMPPGVSKPSPT